MLTWMLRLWWWGAGRRGRGPNSRLSNHGHSYLKHKHKHNIVNWLLEEADKNMKTSAHPSEILRPKPLLFPHLVVCRKIPSLPCMSSTSAHNDFNKSKLLNNPRQPPLLIYNNGLRLPCLQFKAGSQISRTQLRWKKFHFLYFSDNVTDITFIFCLPDQNTAWGSPLGWAHCLFAPGWLYLLAHLVSRC